MVKENTKQHILRQTGMKYRRGEVRIEHAANQGNKIVWAVIDYVNKEYLQPPKQSFEELEKEYEDTQNLL